MLKRGSPFIAFQLAPPSVVLNPPPLPPPTYAMFALVGSTARACHPSGPTKRPFGTAAHVVAPFVVLNTVDAAAYTVLGLDGASAREPMLPPCGPWLVHSPGPAYARGT